MPLFNHFQGTTDWEILKSMSEEDLKAAGVDLEELEKAMSREGMTQKEVQVTRNGKTFTRKQWVKTGQGDTKNKETNKVKHVVNKDNKEKDEGDKYKKEPVTDSKGNKVQPGDTVTWAKHSSSGKPLKKPGKGEYLGTQKAETGKDLPMVRVTSGGKDKGKVIIMLADRMNSKI